MSHSPEEYELAIKMMARELLKKSEHPKLLIISDDGDFSVYICGRQVGIGKTFQSSPTTTLDPHTMIDIGDRLDYPHRRKL